MEREFIETYQGYDIYKDEFNYFVAEMVLSPIAKDINELKSKIDNIERQKNYE